MAKSQERLTDVLNEAERGGSVVIERRDVQHVVRATRKPSPRRARRSVIETLDRAVATGLWHWTLTPKGVRFGRRRQRS